jgi:hypothetical protein
MFVELILTRTVIAIGIVLALSGCGAILEGVQSSNAPPVSKFEVKDLDTFRIIDDPQEGKLIISRGPMALTSAALTTILSFGNVNPDSPEPIMESAAASYLKSTGRDCSVAGGRELTRMQWEFRYQCKSAS